METISLHPFLGFSLLNEKEHLENCIPTLQVGHNWGWSKKCGGAKQFTGDKRDSTFCGAATENVMKLILGKET